MMKTQAKQTAAVLFATVVLATMLPGVNLQTQCRSIVQNKTQAGWRVYSPPDKSFTVELPGEPHPTDDYDFMEGGGAAFFKCTKSADSYQLDLQPESVINSFSIGVFDVSTCKRRPETFNEEIEAIIPIIGGDDKLILRDSKLRVDGLPAREFIYKKGIVYGRVLIVNAGKRIFLLIYASDIPEATSSPEAARMFKTFHPAKR
ncbi:MAG: hypothetical protein MSG64_21040 [Pyrinomonadaceae bacterium MAG19_C2-C3]|nr:hypothetical protein [Pyrinomonadaceae bacterium MAG19_C2-C3]